MKPGATVAWLTAEHAAKYLDFPSVAAFHTFLSRERARKDGPRVKVHWLRGRMRFRATDLDRLIEAEPMAAQAAPLRVVTGGRS